MYQKSFLLLLLTGALWWFPLHTSAHTGLESSTPGANQTVQPTDKLTLRFESEIEAGGSLQVSAVDASDNLEGTFTQESERMILTLDRPMAPGKYQVDWKIIGTDGHPINGTYTFTVVSSNTTSEPEEETSSLQKETKKVAPSQVTTRTTEDGRFPFWIAGGLFVLALYGFYQIILKGRKR